VLIETLRQARRVIVAVVGFTIVLLGIAMIVMPGPGWLVILAGLSILSGEFLWARRLLNRIKKAGKDLTHTVFGTKESPAPGRSTPYPRHDS
jgi:tellurite resistance protein TerC